jgi:hypothetical protein
MTSKNQGMVPDIDSDPFGERSPAFVTEHLQLLGGRFQFDSNSRELLRLVDSAYAGVPSHRLSAKALDFRVSLLLSSPRNARRAARGRRALNRREAPPIAMLHGAGLLGGATELSNFAVMSEKQRAALVVVSPQMMRFPYHTRYELIELAVFTLAARVQQLVPLHAACIGHNGRGLLLMGPSGAGKSTVALHCLLNGFDFLSEDSVFVAPSTMLATGVANFLHIRADSLRWLGRSAEAAALRKSPVIRRRSGVKKFEIDLRRDPFRLAQAPLKIVGLVFLSSQAAGAHQLLKLMPKSDVPANLAAVQAYGASQPQWRTFIRKVSRLDVFELCRGRHPLESVEVLRHLLASGECLTSTQDLYPADNQREAL